MTKNNIHIVIILLICICGCKQKETSPVDSKSLSIYPSKAKIGDTIVIKGIHVEKTLRLSVNQGPFFGGVNDFKILKKDGSEITAVLPEVQTEKVLITLFDSLYPSFPKKAAALDSVQIEIVGLIPIDPKGIGYSSDINIVGCVDEKLYLAVDAKNVYRSIDGGYNWQSIKTHEGLIADVFFINKDQGWISLFTDNIFNGAPGGEIVYTNDSGKSYQKLIVQGLDDQYITDMFFINAKEGYLLSNKGSIWRTNNNKDFELIYAFPDRDLSNAQQFSRFFVVDGKILAYGKSGLSGNRPVIIRGNSKGFGYKYYDKEIWKIQKPVGGLTFAIFERRLYSSSNYGETWEKVGDTDLLNIYFFDNKYGIGSTKVNGFGDEVIVETRNGGKTWTKQRNLGDFVFSKNMEFSAKSGLIGGYRGHMWKYVLY